MPNAWPVVLKAVSGGYDGKGVWVCESTGEVEEVIAFGIPLLAEEFVPFRRELAALVARSPSGQGAAYPVVQTVQADGICREVIAPAPGLKPDVAVEAEAMALKIAAELGVTGLLAVELFETGNGGLLVNELAMRPHNSGHWTIEGARRPSSSSTCVRCSTCRSGLVRRSKEPLPSWRTCSAVPIRTFSTATFT